MKIDILNIDGKVVGSQDLDPEIFGLMPRKDILSRVIEWQLAKRRAGTHKTKLIAEISGTTKKSVKQKGTGGARHGSRRAAQFRGGTKIFGPVVRSHAYDLQKKVRKLGLRIALSSKMKDQSLIVLDQFAMEDPKTRNMIGFLANHDLKSVLFVDSLVNENVRKASANLIEIDVLPQIGANVYDIMRKEKLILTVDAVKALEARLK